MKMRQLKAFLLLLVLFGTLRVSGQEQTFDGCLNYDQLYALHRGNVLSMGQLMGKQRFFMVSNDNNISFIRQGDTLTLNLCNWQFAQGFNDIYVNAFYKDGFYNFIEYNTTSNCAKKLLQECKSKYLELTGDSIPYTQKTFTFPEGHQIIFPETEKKDNQHLIQCYDPSNFKQLTLLSKTQQEQEQVVHQIKEQTILRNMEAADSLAKNEQYPEAISMLEEVYDLLPEYMSTIDTKLGLIKKEYKEKKIQTYTETGEKLYNSGDYEGALEMFSKVLKEDINNPNANEHIASITRKLDILHQRGQVTYDYRESNPVNYEDFCHTLENELNQLIDNTPDGSLKLDFSIVFDTMAVNQSFYNIIAFNTIAIEKNYPVLQSRMSNLLGNNALRPSYREGIPVRAAADIKIDLIWDNWSQQLIKKRKKTVNCSPYELNPSITDVLQNDNRMYYGKYQFETKSKTINGKNYHDIYLTQYKTVGGEAFVYGLIPGLGTLIATQGKEGAVNMALSLLFYGGATTSYVFFKKFEKEYETNSTTLSEKDAKSLNTKKEVCKWSAVAGVSIGGTIQLGGMIKALVRGIQNKKASKELRQALKNEPIEIKKENIHIQ